MLTKAQKTRGYIGIYAALAAHTIGNLFLIYKCETTDSFKEVQTCLYTVKAPLDALAFACLIGTLIYIHRKKSKKTRSSGESELIKKLK